MLSIKVTMLFMAIVFLLTVVSILLGIAIARKKHKTSCVISKKPTVLYCEYKNNEYQIIRIIECNVLFHYSHDGILLIEGPDLGHAIVISNLRGVKIMGKNNRTTNIAIGPTDSDSKITGEIIQGLIAVWS